MRLLLVIVICGWCTLSEARDKKNFQSADYIQALKKVTDVMLDDVTSPVAAGRYYAHITLVSNEIYAAVAQGKHHSFAGELNGFQGLNTSNLPIKEANATLSSILAIFKAAEKLLPSGFRLHVQSDSMIAVAKLRGFTQQQIDATVTVADALVKQYIAFVKTDGFSKLSGLPRYTPRTGDAWWQPTPPAFMAPVEPHWGTIRTFVLDSSRQFKPVPPAVYDTTQGSPFRLQMQEVYDIAARANADEQSIAMFWDCNPFAVQQIGHVQFGLKKISPGGHWIGITGIACLKSKASLSKTILAHTLVSITLCDAFISCWAEKYHSNRVRPETAICKTMNPRWKPLLQTPPFPEYVSGHSVASSAVAEVLTALFGDKFSFTDTTEVEFDLPVRHFSSFHAAAAEAGISRLYGGIHFRDAIDQGSWMGGMIGKTVVARFKKLF